MTGRISRKKEVDLEEMVAKGKESAYEALQLYKSKINRHQQRLDYDSAITVAVKGTRALLLHSYAKAGLEMSIVVLDLFDISGRVLDIDNRSIINELDGLFPIEERLEFLKKCLKWSMKTGNRIVGDNLLNVQVGLCFWTVNNNSKAIFHLVAGEAPSKLWEKISETFTPVSAERDCYYTLGVLHFLAMENLRDANELRMCYEKDLKARNVARESALTTFCTHLLLVCRRDAAPLFKELYVANKPHLATCDPAAIALLEGPIAQIFFNIQPAPSMLNMLQGLLG